MAFNLKFWQKNKTVQSPTNPLDGATINQSFGVPLVKIKGGDITKPFIQSLYGASERYVDFGIDNLFPSIIDQMYYQSPLHSSIIDFQINTALGGGFYYDNEPTSVRDRVELKTVQKRIKLKKLLKSIALDLKMHKRFHLLVTKDDDGGIINIKRLLPASVRYNASRTKYWVNDNWMYTRSARVYKDFEDVDAKQSIYSYVDIAGSPGQDIYPLDKTVSVYNWCYLDGESSVLQKKNIERSIFGNIIIRRPKEFKSDEEFNDFKKGIENKEGEIVPVLLLTSDSKDTLPEVDSFPANQNDKAFENLDKRIDDKICQAHTINPVVMGIQRPGGLGNGSDIKEAYPIWEKNVIIPFREEIEEVVNEIFSMFNLYPEFKLNDYSIIDYKDGDTAEETIKENKKD